MSNVLETVFQQYIHKSRYSRWDEKANRREEWPESVSRYFNFFEGHLDKNFNFDLKPHRDRLEGAFLSLEAVGSMRALMTAGKALERDHVAGYNCAYMNMGRQRALDELMYILLCGTGEGFSVERQFINNLIALPDTFYPTDTTIHVADSKIGWAKGFKELIAMLCSGQIPKWDTSKVRPEGAKLKTFGGRASGPAPLEDLFRFTVETFRHAAGRKLNSLELHDINCKVAQIVIVGGVRRSALISLSNLTDERMRKAKSGNWWEQNLQRRSSNNSVAYTEKTDVGIFMKEWLSLYDSKSGERGIINRQAAWNQVKRANDFRKAMGLDIARIIELVEGTNPCSEILLRNMQFCNLSESVIRPGDTLETMREKVIIATILGTMQSTLTNFRYLSKEWKKNCEEERLLGVSLTGILDNPLFSGKTKGLEDRLISLRKTAIETNIEWAEKLGINPSTAITCVKPSGTVSCLVNSSSGIHARHSEYYIRRAEGDKKDSLCKFLIDQGIPMEDKVGEPNTAIFSFLQKSPKGAILRDDRGAIEQLELWKVYQDNWCDHKPSITVTVAEPEWVEVGAWVYKNFDNVSGVSFMPRDDHIYQQAPYEEIDSKTYNKMLKDFPKEINWDKLSEYEKEDNTIGSQEMACTGPNGGCEIL